MLRRILFPLMLGAGGVAILLWLGTWQLQRLAWKEGILAEIDGRLSAAPVALPQTTNAKADNYRSVQFTGTGIGPELHVLVSGTAAGTGYRAIRTFETTDGRRILVDQGLLALEDKDTPATDTATDILGTMIWPDDKNSSTPDPDLGRNIWFAREVDAMAAALDTEPLMVVARQLSPDDPRLTPLPVDTSTIKNDHREYAITWFLLAFVWALMSGYLIRRTLRQRDD